jgi:hypothetical protein
MRVAAPFLVKKHFRQKSDIQICFCDFAAIKCMNLSSKNEQQLNNHFLQVLLVNANIFYIFWEQKYQIYCVIVCRKKLRGQSRFRLKMHTFLDFVIIKAFPIQIKG